MSLYRLAQYIDNQFEPFELNVDPADESYILAKNFVKTFTTYDPESYGYTFRASAIGKHPALVAWEYFHPKQETNITLSTRFKFLTGYAFESAFNMLLRQLGIEYNSQEEVSFVLNDFSIGAHPDYIIEDTTGKWILETKCCNATTFNQWKKAGRVDRIDYQMQLAMYCLRLKAHGSFVVANVDTGELALYPMSYDDIVKNYKERVLIALANCSHIVDCKEWWQTLERIAPPEPAQRKDGSKYFPMGMYQGKGQLHPLSSIYNYIQREDGTYEVTGWNYPLAAKQWEPLWT
jgi:hypothetical protein